MLPTYLFVFLVGLSVSGSIHAFPVKIRKTENVPVPIATPITPGSTERRFSPNPVEITQKADKESTQETDVILQRWKKILSGLGISATGIKVGRNELVSGNTHRLYYEIIFTNGPTPININTAISQFDKSLSTEPIPGVSPVTLPDTKPSKPGASADVVLD